MIFKFKGVVKPYAWGNSWFIPSIVGGPVQGPKAEYWMGTHHNGESIAESGSKLSDMIGHRLPFLLKILAIESPLAIQCHPNSSQAIEGWNKERRLRNSGFPCNYQDSNKKAEAFIALSPVSALCGFLPILDIKNNLQALIPSCFGLLSQFLTDQRSLFFGLYSLPDMDRISILADLRRSIGVFDETSLLTPIGVIRKCLEMYPDDISCLFPIIMNFLTLQPGEGIYLEPDVLHAYCFGNGVEIMNSSDNVLRAGLTLMRKDLEELKRIAIFDEYHPSVCPVLLDGKGIMNYEFPDSDFSLFRIHDGKYPIHGEGDSICLVIDGSYEIRTETETIKLSRGECVFIPKSTDYEINGKGLAFFAMGVGKL